MNSKFFTMQIIKNLTKRLAPLNVPSQQFCQKRNCFTGFTLVEILLALFLIVFFTGLTIANYKTGGRQLALQRSANQLAQDIRRAEQKAISTVECQECGGIIPQGGYGIYLCQGDNSYLLYADTSPAGGNGAYDDGGDDIVETIDFETGVYIESIAPVSDMSINFQAPEPLITISGGANSATITLALEDTSPLQTIAVEVNTAGLVEIK